MAAKGSVGCLDLTDYRDSWERDVAPSMSAL